MSVSAISRVLNVKLGTVYSWVKKARQAEKLLRYERERRRGGRSGEAKVISFDKMWTYMKSRRKGKRNSVWVWTTIVEEEDESRWMDYEVVGCDEATFLRLCKRLPDAGLYRSDGCNVYKWLPRNRHEAGKGGEVNRLVRKIKGYSKSVDMLIGSLAIIWIRLDWI